MPRGQVETYGPEVAEVCALAGFAPDPEQELLLDLTFAVDGLGRSLAFEVDVIAPRQNLKTGFILQCELGWLFVTEQQRITHSAHELDTTEEAFSDLATLIEDTPSLSARLAPTRGERPGILMGSGRWGIRLRSGQRIKYKARTKDGGRGLAGGRVVLDEAFALTASHMGALLPTLSAYPDPQLVKASSAGKIGSEVLIEARDRGRAGASPRHLWAEWGDRKAGGCAAGDVCDHAKTAIGCALDDEERWAQIMPALGRRITLETVRAQRQALPPTEFAREFMVWWDVDDDHEEFFGPAWAQRSVGRKFEPGLPAAFAVARSYDLAYTSIASASTDAPPHVAATDWRRGIEWVVAEAKRIHEEHGIPCVIDGKGPTESLITAIQDAGVLVIIAGTEDYLQACADFYDAVQTGGMTHGDYPELNDAAAAATRRSVGERWAWARKNGDISMLEAATLALWGAGQGSGFNIW